MSNFPPKRYSVIKCLNHSGQRKNGVQLGPNAIYNNYLFGMFQQYLMDVPGNKWVEVNTSTINDVPFSNAKVDYKSNTILNASHVSSYCSDVFDKNIESYEKKSNLIINLIGDHSAALGTVMSSVGSDRDFKLVWIDAHADINTSDTSFTGNCHGMPLSMASKLSDKYLSDNNIFEWLKGVNKFDLNNLIYVAIRDIDAGEAEIIKKHNITVISMDDIRAGNVEALINKISGHNVHVSFDVDSLDPIYFSATGTPVPNGLHPSELKYLIGIINKFGNIFKLDIAEFNPLIGTGISSNLAHLADVPFHNINSQKHYVELIINNVLAPTFRVPYLIP
jgi:arginase